MLYMLSVPNLNYTVLIRKNCAHLTIAELELKIFGTRPKIFVISLNQLYVFIVVISGGVIIFVSLFFDYIHA